MKNKKAQAWSLDIAIASVIFLSGVIILYVYAINYTSQSKNILEELSYEGNLASELMLSNDLGILKDNENKVDNIKLSSFNCDSKKAEFGLTHKFYFNLGGVDYCTVPASSESLFKITRVTIYENKPAKLEVFVYE
jgi:hypothetical protein